MIKNSKKKLFTGLCVAAVVGLSSAGVRAQDKASLAPGTMDFLASTTISGYVDVMYAYDLAGAKAHGGTIGANGLGPRANDFTLAQFKLVLDKPLDKSDWAAGYRVDIVGGQDSGYASAGLGASNLTLNQAYVTARIPAGSGINLKFGKYYVPFGNEVFETPSNFNITRSYLFQFAQPTTLTGIEVGYTWGLPGGVTLDVLAGIANGWDIVADNDSSKTYYTQGRATFWDGKASIATGIIAGTEGGSTGDYRWLWDTVVTLKPIDKLTLSLNTDYGQESFVAGGHNTFYGASGILNYKWTDMLDTSFRAEFFSDRDGSNSGNTRTSPAGLGLGAGGFDWSTGGADLCALTSTVNFNIWKNLLTRVELRYAHSSEEGFAQSGGANNVKRDQFGFAVEAAYLF